MRPWGQSVVEKWWVKLLRGGLVVAASTYVLLFLVLMGMRAGFQYELEWMEGGVLQHIDRIMRGEAVYTTPTLEYVPFIYPPLYYVVCGGMARLFGLGFFVPRMISGLCALGTMLLIYLTVRRETKDRLSPYLAAGLYAATYSASGYWLDLARVDSLSAFLMVGGVMLSRRSSHSSQLVAGLLLALAFFTKQSVLIATGPVVLCHILARRRGATLFCLALIAAVAVGLVYLVYSSGGWYIYYVFRLPASHPFYPSMLTYYWMVDIWPVLPVVIPMTIVYLWQGRREGLGGTPVFYGSLLLGCLAAGWLGRLHVGGAENGGIPVYAAGAIIFGLGIHYLTNSEWGASVPQLKATVYGLAMAQFLVLAYNPAKALPPDRGREHWKWVEDLVRNSPGEVYMPAHGYLAARAGKTWFAHTAAILDVLRGPQTTEAARLEDSFQTAIKSRRFSAVLLNNRPDVRRFEGTYELLPTDFDREGQNLPELASGLQTSPRYFMVPK
ncbi:MAG: glycosyltransferase family 39 protein [Candidatus Sumerlaeaceae bacterium]|nr:glycosyltransferase family 39 protein [Candidatus Sumerlaeaceae bacterium]